MGSSYKPQGYSTVSPYLIVGDASRTIEFLVRVFDAVELRRFPGPAGQLMHAEVVSRASDEMVATVAEAAKLMHVEEVGSLPREPR